ncbi:breast carcinoma-amplified sequence 1 [Perognathus longimembris pacificus]|uniref:breast carcinoma-amplified sequence 1 n=1 Tax=Perognathus longimembris pacificus TaxID=214514 RepID=UPI002018BFF5|nr:breast carcinoma-amplified sequence 1 [Perognathus longimembris pacificus]
MGNQMSVPQRVEDQENESEADTPIHKVTWDSGCDQNGVGVILSTHTVQHYKEVDVAIGAGEDQAPAEDAAAQAGGKNLGPAAKPQAPAAKSRFFLPPSRPVPGRPGDRGSDSGAAAAAGLDGSAGRAPADKGPSEHVALPGADKTPGRPPAGAPGAPATCSPAPLPPRPRPQDASIFHKLFKLERGGDAAPGHHPGEARSAERGEQARETEGPPGPAAEVSGRLPIPGARGAGRRGEWPSTVPGARGAEVSGRPPSPERGAPRPYKQNGESTRLFGRVGRIHYVHIGQAATVKRLCGSQETADNEEAAGPGTGSARSPAGLEITEEARPATETAESSSVMSFLKTLVSPNKAETKKDPKDKPSKPENLCDGQAGQKTSESQAKGSKKKRLDSPRLGLNFRRFFRHKGPEMPPTPSANLKSDKGNVTSQETQGSAKSAKGCNAPGHGPSVTSSDTPKEGDKEKSGPSSLPLGKLFWKKSVKEESVCTGAEENVACEPAVEAVEVGSAECALHTVDLSEGQAAPEPAEAKLREEASTPRRSPLMVFLRQMSVRGDGGITRSEEVDGKDSSCQTSNSSEKATPPPEPEPPGAAPKGKEGSSKEKKSAPEVNKPKSNKQEAKEPAQCTEQARVDSNSLQNEDKAQKRPEKRRQSLGGFLKGLGPKRMLDAQVQTDPVSIGPVGKAK